MHQIATLGSKKMHFLLSYPSIVERYSTYFEECFSAANLRHFKKAVSGFILSENKTVSGINDLFLVDQRDQSTLNRFFTQQPFDLEQVNEARMGMLQSSGRTRLKPGRDGGGVISVDNSLLKHYGKRFDNIYYHYDYVHRCFRWSHDLVSLYYSDDSTDYPLDWVLWAPPDWEAVARFFQARKFTINEDKWESRHGEPQKWRNYIRSRYRAGCAKHPGVMEIYKTKLHLAADLLRRFRAAHAERQFPVALDSGYTSPVLCDVICRELRMDYVGSLREDQKIADPDAPSNMITLEEWVKRLRAQQNDGARADPLQKTSYPYRAERHTVYSRCLNVRVSKYKNKQRLVVSFMKEDLSDRPNFSISNRLDWHASGILRIRRHRWPVETYHQEGKAEGLEAYQVRRDKGVQTHIAMVAVAFSMLKMLVHDDDFLSELQQRLQTESGPTLPSLKRLMGLEQFYRIVEHIFVQLRRGQSVHQIFEFFAPKLV